MEWKCHIFSPTGFTGSVDEIISGIIKEFSTSRRLRIIARFNNNLANVVPENNESDGALIFAVIEAYLRPKQRSYWESSRIRAETLGLISRRVRAKEPEDGQYEESFSVQLQRFATVITLYYSHGLSRPYARTPQPTGRIVSRYDDTESQDQRVSIYQDFDTPMRCIVPGCDESLVSPD